MSTPRPVSRNQRRHSRTPILEIRHQPNRRPRDSRACPGQAPTRRSARRAMGQPGRSDSRRRVQHRARRLLRRQRAHQLRHPYRHRPRRRRRRPSRQDPVPRTGPHRNARRQRVRHRLPGSSRGGSRKRRLPRLPPPRPGQRRVLVRYPRTRGPSQAKAVRRFPPASDALTKCRRLRRHEVSRVACRLSLVACRWPAETARRRPPFGDTPYLSSE
jgi:hypothetical protein